MLITSRENELVKQYCKISSQKKYREQTGLFCLEGVRLVCDAIKSGVVPEKILITEKCLQKYHDELGNLLKTHDMIMISDAVAQKMASVEHTQGVFALVKMLDKTLDIDTIRKGGQFICLCQLQDPGNLGTIIRTAEAFGINGMILYQTCDLYSPKVVRSTMGSLFRMPFMVCPDLISFTKELQQNRVKTFATVVDSKANSLVNCDFSGASVLYIGNEGNGLPEHIVTVCDFPVTIRMKGNAESLNAAVAAQICMWEMTKEG